MGGTGADSITTGSSTSFVFGDDGYISWVGAELNPDGFTVGRRKQRPGQHRRRRLDDTRRRRRRPRSRSAPARRSSSAAWQRHDHRRQRHERDPRRLRDHLLGLAGHPPVRRPPDHDRHGRDDGSGHRRRRHDHVGHGQRDRDGRHRADSITTGSSTSFVFGDDGYISWVGAELNPDNLDLGRRERDPATSTVVASTSTVRRRRRPHHDRLRPRDRRRRPGQRPDHRRLRHERDPRRHGTILSASPTRTVR